MIKVFQTTYDFEGFTEGGMKSGNLYYVIEDKSVHFTTNNIDGTSRNYGIGVGDDIVPEGNIDLTVNGNNIDVSSYATASVNVPIPAGYIQPSGNYDITVNGNYDISSYATAYIDVPIPAGYIQPSGNYDITVNGNYDVSSYATAYINVASGGGDNTDFINLIERDVTTINIPSGTTSIGQYTFYHWESLTNVTIPSSVTNIGVLAFAESGLTNVTIPDSVTSIGNSAFYSCRGLTSITIGNGVTSIGNNAFYDCRGLTSVTIPDSVTSIGNGVFSGCRGLTSITVEAEIPPILVNANAFNNNASGRKIYVPAASVEAYKVADNWSTYAADIEAIPPIPPTAKWSNTHNTGTTMDRDVSYNESVIAVQVGGQPVTCTFDGTPSTGWTITQNGLGKSTASVTLNGLNITVDPSMANNTNGTKALTISRDADSSYSAGTAYFKVRVLQDNEDTNFFWNGVLQNIPAGQSKFIKFFNYYSSTNIQFTSGDPDITVVGGYNSDGYYGATVTSINNAPSNVPITATLYDTNNNVLATATVMINPT